MTYGDGPAYTIVGVMPQGLDYPKDTDFWAPVVPSMSPDALSLMGFYVIGRLVPGATPRNAGDELTTYLRRADASPWQRELHGVATLWPRIVIGDVRPAVMAFAAAAGLLLLITCTNVANLLLVRGIARVRELAVRLAIGATRTRIVLQLFTENALLAIAGGALGVAVAAGAVRLFIALAPPDVPRLDEVHLNAVALASALGITTIAIMLFGLAPAILASRVQLEAALRSDTRQSTTRSRIGAEALVAAQFALALLVLAGAGLVGRSLLNLQRAQLSLNPSRLLIGELALRSDLLASPEKQRAMLEQLIPQLEAIPGVRAVSPVVAVPFSGAAGWDGKPAAEGQSPEEAAANPMLNMEVVAPGYFTTLGVPVLRGRIFTDRDREDAPAVVVVSQSAARHYWPGDDPIGKRLMMGDDLERVFTVIGVVPDTRYRDLREARPSIYFPLSQSFFPFVPTTLAIGTDSPSAAPVSTIRRVISETAPGVALVSAASFGTFLEGPLAQPRMNAFLLAVFAAAALTLASVGLFGVMATMIRQRTKELGIRLALGASPRDLERMVMRRGLTIGTAGLVVGLLGAFLANRLIAALLYEVSPTDGVTLLVVAALLVGIAGLASAIAARQSTRIDPVLDYAQIDADCLRGETALRRAAMGKILEPARRLATTAASTASRL